MAGDAHPFGDEPAERPVKPVYFDPCEGYIPHGEKQFARRSDGKWMRVDHIQRTKEPQMPPTAVLDKPMTLTPSASQPTLNVYGCIVAVSRDIAVDGISKTRSNAQQNYKFRGIDDVFNALSPLLAKHGLVILPRVLSRSVVERETRNGGVLFYVTVEAEFDFVSAGDGSTHTVKTYGEAMDSADKATNKAMSAAYKYAAFQTFCIPTEGDNDADAVTHDVKPRPAFVTTSGPNKNPLVAASSNGRTPAFEAVGVGSIPAAAANEPDVLPEGFRLIDDYKLDGDWHHITWGRDAQGGWMVFKTKLAKIGLEAHNAFTERMPVMLHWKKLPYVDRVEKLGATVEQIASSKFNPDDDRFCDECNRPVKECMCK